MTPNSERERIADLEHRLTVMEQRMAMLTRSVAANDLLLSGLSKVFKNWFGTIERHKTGTNKDEPKS